jgi:hypothetical protein
MSSPSLFPSLFADTMTGLELMSVDLPRAPLDEPRWLPVLRADQSGRLLFISNAVSTSLDPLFFSLCIEPLGVAVASDFDRPVLLMNPRLTDFPLMYRFVYVSWYI